MTSAPIGVVAGCGSYPTVLTHRLLECGERVVVAGISGHASKSDFRDVPFRSFCIGEIRATCRYLRANGADRVLMAGGINWRYSNNHMKLDGSLAVALPFLLARGDDWRLRYIANIFERHGVSVENAAQWIGDWIAPRGHLAGPEPNAVVRHSIERGIERCRQFVSADKGQAIAVYGADWMGCEDRYGTSALLRRTPGPGGVLVKMKKKHQDMRFDIPTIGPSTVRIAGMVGVAAIVMEAGAVLLLEPEPLSEMCEERNISLLAF